MWLSEPQGEYVSRVYRCALKHLPRSREKDKKTDRPFRTSHEYAVLIDLARFTRPDSQAQEESTCVYIGILGGNVPGNMHAQVPTSSQCMRDAAAR